MKEERKEASACLLITCPDQSGIVAAVSNFFFHHGANITSLDQHSTDPVEGTFFMRLEFQTPNLDLSKGILESTFQETVAKRYQMEWNISYSFEKKKVAILVSKYDHALLELLWRWSRKELYIDIEMVISNHPDLQKAVENFGIPYHLVPVTKDTKEEAEQKTLELLKQGNVDFVVLARYMQILTANFVSHYPNQVINIHHSFLPAFIGANPYRQAYERGVKLIGATAHYVTSELDLGPIIEQDVIRISHRQNVKAHVELGKDIERTVLARAVKWHAEDRVIVHGNKTIVFN
ncbi:MAG: formyltetrahydrofolate deformylase [bacterium]|jgi:formyltetrahydrofolate deformylase